MRRVTDFEDRLFCGARYITDNFVSVLARSQIQAWKVGDYSQYDLPAHLRLGIAQRSCPGVSCIDIFYEEALLVGEKKSGSLEQNT